MQLSRRDDGPKVPHEDLSYAIQNFLKKSKI